MATFDAHVNIVRHNHIFLSTTLIPKVSLFPDWTVVVAFYSALHMIDAAFFHCHQRKHFNSHDERNAELKTRTYSHIWKYYRPLYSASRAARYLDAGPGKSLTAFSNYMTPETVMKRFIDFELPQVKLHTEQIIDQYESGFKFYL